MGGLATAARLQKAGASCTIIEKQDKLGGRVGEYTHRGHRWETGASLLLLPDIYKETLEAVDGEPIEVRRVDPAYSVFFDGHADRGPVVLGGSSAALKARLDMEAPDAFEKFEEYGECAREYLRAGWPIFIEEDLSLKSLLTLPRFLLNALAGPWRWPLFSHDRQLRRLFPESPRMRALCSFDDLYVGLTPQEAPAVFSLLAAIELDGAETPGAPRPDAGVFYPVGGFGTFLSSLERAAIASGVAIRTGVEVTQVLTSNGSAVGVRCANGDSLLADHVIVNADLSTAEPKLLSESPGASREDYTEKQFSTSSITFLWALDSNETLAGLTHHNVFLAESSSEAAGDDPFKVAWSDQLPRKSSAGDFPNNGFHFYCCAPSRTDETAAPEGRDTLMVLVPTPPLGEAGEGGSDDDDVDGWIEKARAAVLERLEKAGGCGDGCGDVWPHVVHERVIDPREWRDSLGLRRGSVFGLSHGLDQLAIFRPSRKSRRVDNLFFVGASTRPGNGVPLVLTSARLLSEEIVKVMSNNEAK